MRKRQQYSRRGIEQAARSNETPPPGIGPSVFPLKQDGYGIGSQTAREEARPTNLIQVSTLRFNRMISNAASGKEWLRNGSELT